MPIRLIQGASFDAETTRLLGLAYERACEDLAPDVTVREAVAKRIIAAAKGGERDVERLINFATRVNFCGRRLTQKPRYDQRLADHIHECHAVEMF